MGSVFLPHFRRKHRDCLLENYDHFQRGLRAAQAAKSEPEVVDKIIEQEVAVPRSAPPPAPRQRSSTGQTFGKCVVGGAGLYAGASLASALSPFRRRLPEKSE